MLWGLQLFGMLHRQASEIARCRVSRLQKLHAEGTCLAVECCVAKYLSVICLDLPTWPADILESAEVALPAGASETSKLSGEYERLYFLQERYISRRAREGNTLSRTLTCSLEDIEQ